MSECTMRNKEMLLIVLKMLYLQCVVFVYKASPAEMVGCCPQVWRQ